MESERKLQKKIEKYKEKLERKRRRRLRRESSRRRSTERSRSRSPVRSSSWSPTETPEDNQYGDSLPADCNDTVQDPPITGPVEEVELNHELPSVQDHTTALLQALGKDYETSKQFEGQIHHDISKRWAYILVHGLSKTEREVIIEGHNIPENCQLLDAPKLNDEVLAALTENSKHRDKGIAHQQQQLGTAVAIIGKVMSSIIEENTDMIPMLKSLGEATKLLTDLHHQQTKTRRVLVAPLIEKSFLQLMENTKRNEYLYGDNLGEKIKSNKQLQQNSMAIKKPIQKTMASSSKANKPSGNHQGPPRHTNARQPIKAMARGGLKYRATQPSQQQQQQRTPHSLQRSERTRGAYNKRQ